jgi:hypothetical protein
MFLLAAAPPTQSHADPRINTTPDRPDTQPPPAEPPPPSNSTLPFPPCSLVDNLMRPPSPTSVTTKINICNDQLMDSSPSELPRAPAILDSVTHVVCSPRVCGLDGDNHSSVQVMHVADSTGRNGNLIDGGSNVCITGDLTLLLDVVDITPIPISVAINGDHPSLGDKISKRGLLPLTLSDGTIYYQPCFYCANMVETIISPAAVLTSSNVFYYWTQEGCKDPSVPGRFKFCSRDGLLLMQFDLVQQDGLYYCDTNTYTVDRDPVKAPLPTLRYTGPRQPT